MLVFNPCQECLPIRAAWALAAVLGTTRECLPIRSPPRVRPTTKRLTAALCDAIHRDDPSPAGIRDEGAERTKPTRVVHAIRRNRRPY